MLNVYKVKFTKSSFALNDDYDRLSDIDKEKISDLDAFAFFDYEEDDVYSFLIIVEPLQLRKYTNILDENLIPYKVSNLSKEIINMEVDLAESISSYITSINTLRYSFFLDDLSEWIYENLDIDTVLDRISKVGIENLSKVEKEYLKNYNSTN